MNAILKAAPKQTNPKLVEAQQAMKDGLGDIDDLHAKVTNAIDVIRRAQGLIEQSQATCLEYKAVEQRLTQLQIDAHLQPSEESDRQIARLRAELDNKRQSFNEAERKATEGVQVERQLTENLRTLERRLAAAMQRLEPARKVIANAWIEERGREFLLALSKFETEHADFVAAGRAYNRWAREAPGRELILNESWAEEYGMSVVPIPALGMPNRYIARDATPKALSKVAEQHELLNAYMASYSR